MQIAENIARSLLKIEAVKLQPENPFTWASGIKSPIYTDNRVALAYPEVRKQIIDGFVDLASKIQGIDVVAGVATAGIPHAALLAERLSLPMAYVRASAKTHGRGNRIEGKIEQGQRVLLIEDLISQHLA